MSLRSRLVRLAVRLPRRTIRFRLTVVYGALFSLCGVGLLAVVYLLVRFTLPAAASRRYSRPPTGSSGGPPAHLPSLASLRAQSNRQRDADLHQILVVSVLALAIMLVVSIALGWLVAGRVLRPLRTITATARDLSSATLNRRLALAGPDDELKELGDTFDELLGRLELSFAAQRQFVANASHELRTPLTLERALLDAALANPDASTNTLRATCKRLVTVNTEQERLLEALLTLAISERGLDHREPLDLAELTRRVLNACHDQAERLGLQVCASLGNAPTTGDPDLIERLVANLVDNALRYNTPDGQIKVTTGTEPGRTSIGVANTGPDIPAARIEELFQPFRRLGTSRTPPGGSNDPGHGLGLSIVAAIATAHTAEISARPGVGGGLVVTVAFPPGATDGP